MECEYLGEKEHREGSGHVVLCVVVKSTCMDEDFLDESKQGSYGDTGYIYNIHRPIHPDRRTDEDDSIAVLKKLFASCNY